jgi:lysine 2,3-aminomutase
MKYVDLNMASSHGKAGTACSPVLTDLAAVGLRDAKLLGAVTDRYPFRISSHISRLIGSAGDPIWLQVVPQETELNDKDGLEDPLSEEALSPVPNLVHRYPRRVLWLVSHECAVHCRFCTRKRRWRAPCPLTDELFHTGIEYIRSHNEIQDVLLSGGDPMLLPFERLEALLAAVRNIPHVEIIRIGTRTPGALPQRITERLAGLLARFQPVFVNAHFNHPMELTPETVRACTILADAGIPLGSQTVLLRGVNDDAAVLGELFQRLLRLRVRPYYLMQMDLTEGTAHFRTPLCDGLKIMRALRNHISGLAMPHFVVDLPGGHGKVPLVPNCIEEICEDHLVVKDYRGRFCRYPLLPGESKNLGDYLTKTR